MDKQQLREQLRAELRRRNLPRAYVERLSAEWEDHFADLLDERTASMSTARMPNDDWADLQPRFGSPAELAAFAAEQYRARSFFGRHPIVTFLVGPLPLLVACWIGFGLLLWAVLFGINLVVEHLLGWPSDSLEAHNHPWVEAVFLALVSWYVMVVPSLASAWLLCRVARRNALGWRWPAIGCTLLAMVSGIFAVSYTLATEPSNGMMVVGFDVSASLNWFVVMFLPKFVVAMCIGLLLVKRAQDQAEVAG